MPLKELLLNSSSFTEVLKRYSINPDNFSIKDELLIMAGLERCKEDSYKDMILIEGSDAEGPVNLIGTVYCNFAKNIAVFELESVEHPKMELKA